MAVVHESSAITVFSSDTTDFTANAPSGVAENDVLVASVQLANTITVTAPSGWVSAEETNYAAGAGKLSVWYKVAGASEPGTYAFTVGTATTGQGT